VNKLHIDWSFPSGTAFEVPAHQMVRIEAHYINTGSTMIEGTGAVTFHGVPKASAPPFTPASFLLWGTRQIDIPAHSPGSAGPNFVAGTAGTHLLSIFTHQHELGTGIEVWESSKAGDMATEIANDPDWSNPSWTLLDKPFDFDGQNGLTYKCQWDNTTNSPITFGESALDEMCLIGGYYYPGTRFDLRLTGNPQQSAPTPGSVDAGAD
jgi:hypothetical protein